jgi:cytochrome c
MLLSLHVLWPATMLVLMGICAQATAGTPTPPDAGKGQRLWQQRCAECHAVDTDETGPRHRGVFGRRAGSVKGYDYSRALRSANVKWDAGSLDRWLTDPEKFIPGQNMDFKVVDDGDRAALIAYLKAIANPVEAATAAAGK